jgi:hypothetical protein
MYDFCGGGERRRACGARKVWSAECKQEPARIEGWPGRGVGGAVAGVRARRSSGHAGAREGGRRTARQVGRPWNCTASWGSPSASPLLWIRSTDGASPQGHQGSQHPRKRRDRRVAAHWAWYWIAAAARAAGTPVRPSSSPARSPTWRQPVPMLQPTVNLYWRALLGCRRMGPLRRHCPRFGSFRKIRWPRRRACRRGRQPIATRPKFKAMMATLVSRMPDMTNLSRYWFWRIVARSLVLLLSVAFFARIVRFCANRLIESAAKKAVAALLLRLQHDRYSRAAARCPRRGRVRWPHGGAFSVDAA